MKAESMQNFITDIKSSYYVHRKFLTGCYCRNIHFRVIFELLRALFKNFNILTLTMRVFRKFSPIRTTFVHSVF